MKTLAVIKNELFQDYLRFVSTSDLPSVLDNPDIPVPFTSVAFVDNSNSDALMEQLKTYFNSSKVNNKDFYKLDEDTFNQLQFMFNLIKLSSGQAGTAVQASAPVKEAASVKEVTPVEVNTVAPAVVIPETNKVEKVQEVQTVEINTPTVNTPEPVAIVQPAAPIVVAQPVVQDMVKEAVKEPVLETETEVEDVFSAEEDDPFGFKSSNEPVKTATVNDVAEVAPEEVTPEPAPIVQPVAEVVSEPVAVIQTPVEAPVVAETVAETVAEVIPEVAPATVALIASLGIPKGATIHFIKDQTITANLVDEKTVSFDGQNMTLVEAAKAAFKKSDTVGMAVGLSNWTFEGETLKAWKEKQLN